MPLSKVPKKFLPKLTSVFLFLYVAATLPLLTNRLTSFSYIIQGIVQKIQKAEGAATESLRQAIQPNSWDGSIYHFLGLQLSNQGKIEEAIAAYRQAIRLDPEYYANYQELGKALATQGKTDEAIATYRQAIKFNPNWTWAYKKLGSHFYWSWKGEESFAVAIRNAPSAADSAKGYTAEALARFYRDEAIATYRQVIKIDPNDAEACNWLGRILQEAGRFDRRSQPIKKRLKSTLKMILPTTILV
ncbi:hypothetical protein BCD67_23175 [Oscillatoriales cyanobacterium USR001]|nr:hypothetical protein BCD67_23175 [Oscillatoriales cyanobacterium USR001]